MKLFSRWTAGVTIVLSLLLLAVACGKGQDQASKADVGLVSVLVGSAELEHEGQKRPLKKGDKFGPGDKIHTGAKAVVVALFGNQAKVEIQENSVFEVTRYDKTNKDLKLAKGNLWLEVNKRSKGENFRLHSPTAIAGVRGTKFFTFQLKDPRGGPITYGTCHCIGAVEISGVKGDKYKGVHKTDFVRMTRNGKTIVLTPEDTPFIERVPGHQHSVLDNSPLGKKIVQFTPEQLKKLGALMEKKFAEVK